MRNLKPEIHDGTSRLSRTDDATKAAARLVVLRRLEFGYDDHEQCHELLDMLGLLPSLKQVVRPLTPSGRVKAARKMREGE